MQQEYSVFPPNSMKCGVRHEGDSHGGSAHVASLAGAFDELLAVLCDLRKVERGSSGSHSVWVVSQELDDLGAAVGGDESSAAPALDIGEERNHQKTNFGAVQEL